MKKLFVALLTSVIILLTFLHLWKFSPSHHDFIEETHVTFLSNSRKQYPERGEQHGFKSDRFGESSANQKFSQQQSSQQVLVPSFAGGYTPHSFPIALVAYNRPDYLRRTLKSLLNVKFMKPELLTVYQVHNHVDEFC